MKPILKFTACIFLLWGIFLISCKKERSCEGCREKNQPPIARAGNDTAIILPIDSVTLNGSASTDPDGTITSYKWTKVSGPSSSNITKTDSSKTLVKGLVTGVYKFELSVTDNGGLSAKDTIQVTVTDQLQTNQPPIANAGADQTIPLPNNEVNLDGSASTDPDNNIVSYAWTKISGPSSSNIVNVNAVQTQVSNLMEGVYQFELKVSDAGGLFAKDTVQVTVNSSNGETLSCDNSNRPTINAQLTPVGTLSQARSFMAVAAAGNTILFAGGVVNTHSSRVDIYDISTNKWSTADLSIARHYIAAVANGNKVFFAGGETSDGTVPTDVVDIYDVSTNTWTVAHLSLAGSHIAAAAVGDKVLFAGGTGGFSGGEARAGRVDIYNLATNTWSTASLSQYKVRGHVAVTANNKVYISGGSTSWLSEAPSNKIEIYDDATNTWSTAKMQEARYRHAGIVAGNKIYWGGGWDGGDGLCSVEIRDVNTSNSTTQYLYRSTEWSYAVVKDNKIVFFGTHYDSPYNSPAADKVDIYDIAGNTWSIGILPFSIGQPSIISVNNKLHHIHPIKYL
jgi:K319L-like, PKD domain/Kelch motif/Galactose oxidase, central domain